MISLLFGTIFSLNVWKTNINDIPSSSGTVAISLITLLIGVNFISYFFVSDTIIILRKTYLLFSLNSFLMFFPIDNFSCFSKINLEMFSKFLFLSNF